MSGKTTKPLDTHDSSLITGGSMLKKLSHVSIAVENVDEAAKFYRDVLGLEVTRTVTLDDRQLKIAFIKIGETELELLEPLNQDNTVRRYLDRWGPGLHHICFEVDDVADSMETLKSRGAEFTDTEPRPGAVGQVAFIAPASTGGVLVEINQEMPGSPALADETTGPVETDAAMTTDASPSTDDRRPTTVAHPSPEGTRPTTASPGSAVLEP
jgi:methylmalonyl-CoA/ethylmalonyl-CoA epimerase